MIWGSTDGESPITPTEESEEECERDDLYYFENVVFKVENKLFRVPKSGLNVEGTVFETMFALPLSTENSGPPEGSTDKSPIILEGISKAHFRGFLRAIYRITASPLTYDELDGAIQLANMWEFGELRERLINELSPHMAEKPTHEIILLARRCKVKKWLIDAYTNRVHEKSSVDLLGLRGKGIDADTIANLFFIREQTGSRPENPTSLINLNYVSNKINEIFASELAVM
ncbi:hypothetical protein BJ912DRAFT_964914, partial [Pholiota molesta]